MTAVEAYEHTLRGATIYRRGWYFRGSEMWHESWPTARVPWQWGPEELAATDWLVMAADFDRSMLRELMEWSRSRRGEYVQNQAWRLVSREED